MKMTDKIKEKLLRWVCVGGYDLAIPNYFVGGYEMDVFLLKPSGQVYEYEIKTSRSDFKADFKKNKTYDKSGNSKHSDLSAGRRDCNKFYFVVPENLITVGECPKYAGLIYYTDSDDYYKRRLRIVKAAPIIKKDKCQVNYVQMCHKLAFRERHWAALYKFERREAKKYKDIAKEILPLTDIRRALLG